MKSVTFNGVLGSMTYFHDSMSRFRTEIAIMGGEGVGVDLVREIRAALGDKLSPREEVPSESNPWWILRGEISLEEAQERLEEAGIRFEVQTR